MHMADALLSPAIGLAADAISVAAIGISVARVRKDEFSEKKVPVIGVAGALVFAAQMINFTIPGTGSSGHIGGGVLLAGLLGGVPAFLSIAAVLIIQCLFFADGGLLALGCNIFNLGVIPCLIVYPLIFKPLVKNTPGQDFKAQGNRGQLVERSKVIHRNAAYKRLSAASVISAIIALELGAFCVVLQTFMSGITQLPFGTFAALMLPIHLAIGLVEGVVTAAILCFVHRMRPEIITSAVSGGAMGVISEVASRPSSGPAAGPVTGSTSGSASAYESEKKTGGVTAKKMLIALAALTVVVGGVLSLFASANPDGLEWAIGKTTSKNVASATTGEEADGAIENGCSMRNTTETGTETGAKTEATSAIAADSSIHNAAAEIQEATAILPDYSFASNPENPAGTSFSGIIGAAVSFAVAGGAALLISFLKRRKRAEAGADA